ncbi:MAG: TetR family transcriptional regulator [Saprospiraceae bacterium]|nr:TetR family transcriptional regulator [Saprospiraceae bacterium]
MTEISAKKQRIYQEAARLFQDRGYAATSMRAIAGAVDLEVSSLYSHIRSKEELLQEICFRTAGQFMDAMQAIRRKWDNPVRQLEEIIRFHTRLALQDPTSATVFSDEWKHLGPEEVKSFVSMRRNYEQQFLEILVQGQRAGLIRDLPRHWIMHTIISGLAWLYRTQHPVPPDEQEHLIQTLLAMNLHGIIKSQNV